jgi:hypothetical protein
VRADFEVKGRETMKLAGTILGIALVLSCGGQRAIAQTDAATTKAPATEAEGVPTCYRLTYTITELDGTKRIGTQHFAVTVDPDSGDSSIRVGSKVPIVTGSTNPENAAQTQFQYVDVGLDISARIKEYPTGAEVHSKIEQSSVSEEQSTMGRNDPVIRQAVLQNTSMLAVGKPILLGSLDVPGSTRHLDIEAVLEPVQ